MIAAVSVATIGNVSTNSLYPLAPFLIPICFQPLSTFRDFGAAHSCSIGQQQIHPPLKASRSQKDSRRNAGRRQMVAPRGSISGSSCRNRQRTTTVLIAKTTVVATGSQLSGNYERRLDVQSKDDHCRYGALPQAGLEGTTERSFVEHRRRRRR